jgi:putative photosynthetic complex assembly protein
MSDPFEHASIPRAALLGLLGLVVFSLLAVIIARTLGYKTGEPLPDSVVEQRDLRFSDGAGGIVYVWDTSDDALLISLQPGSENFIRGVLRSMARERRSRELDRETPFRIARHSDGRLTLDDLATGQRINLKAFGPTNQGAFARLLDLGNSGS